MAGPAGQVLRRLPPTLPAQLCSPGLPGGPQHPHPPGTGETQEGTWGGCREGRHDHRRGDANCWSLGNAAAPGSLQAVGQQPWGSEWDRMSRTGSGGISAAPWGPNVPSGQSAGSDPKSAQQGHMGLAGGLAGC